MTNEQAINWLVQIKGRYIFGGDEKFDSLRREALDLGIKALENNNLRPKGKWINDADHFFCPFCKMSINDEVHYLYYPEKYGFNYCPNCGASMKGGAE